MGIKFPTPWKTLIIKFPPPPDGKGVKCPGYARGGMLKLRFDRYIRAWGIVKSTKVTQMGHRRDLRAKRESHHTLVKQGNTHAFNTLPSTISSFLKPPRFGSGSTERELHAICASVSVQKGTDISLRHLITKMFKSTPPNGLLKGVNNL